MNEHLYRTIAQLVGARARCLRDNVADKHEWADKHEQRIKKLVRDYFPSGSGFDSGTKICLDASSEEKLVFQTSFHHMAENGSYDGWTDHTIRVYPSLAFGFRLTVSGQDRNDIKEYVGSAFHEALAHETPKEQAA